MKVNPKKRNESILAFWQWFNKRRVLPFKEKGLAVPSKILYLPCGCKRRFRTDSVFRIFNENATEEWVHYCSGNEKGKGTPLVPREKVPETNRIRRSVNLSFLPDYLPDYSKDADSALSE